MTLLIRRNPFADESFLGYMLALTELNCGNSITEILTSAGLYLRGTDETKGLLFKPNLVLEPLALITDTDPTTLSSLLYSRQNPAKAREVICSVNGKPIHQYLLRPKAARFCPACLATYNYYHRSWDVALITTCIEHSCRLLDHCPHCQKPVGWLRREQISECVCKFKLTESVPLPVLPAELSLTRYLLRLAGFSTIPTSTGILNQFDLLDFTRVLVFLGSHLSSDLAPIDRGRKMLHELPPDAYHTTVLQAFRALENWPHNYYEFLERLRETPKNGSKPLLTGVHKEFGYFYSDLFGKLKAQPCFTPLREAFLDYATTWDGGYLPNSLRHRAARYLSLAQTKTILKRDSHKIEEWIQDGTLRATTRSWGSKQLHLIYAEDVYRRQTALQQQVPTKKIAQQLQLNPRGVHRLVKADLLKIVSGTGQGKGSNLWFPPDAATELIAKLCQQEQRTPHVPRKRRLTWTATLSLLKQYGLTRDVFYEDVYQGKIRPCIALKGKGLKGLSFETAAIIKYARSYGKEISTQLTASN